MLEGNQIIQSLWIGEELSPMERMSLQSFLRCGHEFHLYIYGEVKGVPDGVVLKDASEILSLSVVHYKDFPKLALFADYFRYKLLWERGGWWSDTDAICFRPFDFPGEHVFACEAMRDGKTHATDAFIKAPAGSPIMEYCWAKCLAMKPASLRWSESGPVLIKSAIEGFGMQQYVQPPQTFCPFPWWEAKKLIDPNVTLDIPEEARAVHLWSNMWSENRMNKNSFPFNSPYEKFRRKFMPMADVTTIIKTFLRDEVMLECVRSLKAEYPDIRVIVLDDGHPSESKTAELARLGVKYLQFSFGSVRFNRSRNIMLDACETPYILVGDDDFVYTPETNLAAMHSLLDAGADIATGAMIQDGNLGHFEGKLERRDDGFYFTTQRDDYEISPTGTRYAKIDLGFNFYMAKKESINKFRYEERLGVGGFNHEDFFISAHDAGLSVVYSPDTSAVHKHTVDSASNEYNKEYETYRTRRYKENKAAFEEKWGLPLKWSPGIAQQGWKWSSLEDVTAIIKTFLRDKSLFRCVQTLKEQYPFMHIIVADDGHCSKEKSEKLKAMGVDKYIEMPWNSGLSAGRNTLLDACDTKYVLLCDDDFTFTDDSHVERLRSLMAVADIAAGMVFNAKNWTCCADGRGWDAWGGHIVRHNGKLYKTGFRGEIKTHNGIRYEEADLVLNFFVGRLEALKQVRWDEEIRFECEHQDFFLRAKEAGIKSVRCLDVQVIHKELDDTSNPEYMKIRTDRVKYWHMLQKKWGSILDVLPGSKPSPKIDLPPPIALPPPAVPMALFSPLPQTLRRRCNRHNTLGCLICVGHGWPFGEPESVPAASQQKTVPPPIVRPDPVVANYPQKRCVRHDKPSCMICRTYRWPFK